MIKRAGMKRLLRTSRTPSRKVVENLEASVQLQEERKREKQADVHRKARKRKLKSLDAKEERLHSPRDSATPHDPSARGTCSLSTCLDSILARARIIIPLISAY